MASRKLKLETKYAIADTVASTFNVDPNWVEDNYKYAFGTILNNAQFRAKGKVYTIKDFCKNEDDALHITSLVIRRLRNRLIQRTVGEVE
jgi:hypothetical protein